MMSKKKYSLPSTLDNDLSRTVKIVENNIGTLNYKIVPIDVIEFDPDNPREMAITRDELLNKLDEEDPLYEKKRLEHESLERLAGTIKKYGVRNAVEIYKCGISYRLVHGERRCLASILAGKKEIPAKILNKKPNNLDIRLLQLIENVQREDLTLPELLNNIRLVVKEYKKHVKSPETVSAVFLEKTINCSKTHALNVIAVLDAPDRLKQEINNGNIKSLEKASLIAKAKKKAHQERLLELCLDGATLKEIKQESVRQRKTNKAHSIPTQSTKKTPGKKASKIKLGATTNEAVVGKIINFVLSRKPYTQYQDQFKDLALDDYDSYKKAFSLLISIMETIEESKL